MQPGTANRVIRLFHSRQQTTGRGPLVKAVFLCGVMGWLGLPDLARTIGSATEMTVDDRVRQWVGELASAKFSIRQSATEKLIAQGVLVLPALEPGLQSSDREVRLRCQRIDRVIRENDFQARLIRFAADTGLQGHGLPKWPAFRNLAGDKHAGEWR